MRIKISNIKYFLKVLIIGGGDGGVAREVAKHPAVINITQVEIDDVVIAVSKQYLPFMGKGLEHPKLTLHVGDGFEFMKQHKNEFDVIITDSSDPVGEYLKYLNYRIYITKFEYILTQKNSNQVQLKVSFKILTSIS